MDTMDSRNITQELGYRKPKIHGREVFCIKGHLTSWRFFRVDQETGYSGPHFGVIPYVDMSFLN